MSTRTHVGADVASRRGDVVAWRYEQLRAHGFAPSLALALARDCRYDLHAVVELVGRGCRPDLAARILAPAVDEARPC